MPDFGKVGGDTPGMKSTTHQTGMRFTEAMAEFFEAENAQHQSSHQIIQANHEHSLKIKKQYLFVRWVISLLAIIIPPVLLFCVINGVLSGAFVGLHPVAQALLISGAIATFVMLYGVVLHHVYKGHFPRDALGGTPEQDASADDKNAESDELLLRKQIESIIKAFLKEQ